MWKELKEYNTDYKIMKTDITDGGYCIYSSKYGWENRSEYA